VFALFDIVGIRLPVVLIVWLLPDGFSDIVHEVHAFAGASPFGGHKMTELPLAYGAFSAAFDWCIAAYFCIRRPEWNAAWKASAR
jgi:hypothetical protein